MTSSTDAQDKLDLSSLRSYSPEWSPDLRLTVCVAVKYAVQRLCQRVKATQSQRIATDALTLEETEAQEPETGLVDDFNIDEEGERSKNSRAGIVDEATQQQMQKKRKELIDGWQEFGQKFLTAACQHLGIVEEILPPGPIAFTSVYEAGQGRPKPEASASKQERSDPEGLETGSAFSQLHYQTVFRSDVPSDKVRAKSKTEEKELKDAELTSDQFKIASPESTLEKDIQGLSLENKSRDESKRIGGALIDGTSRDRDYEVCNDLLLIALGLGQYRSEDGSTTLFEQDAIFEDVAPSKASGQASSSLKSQSGAFEEATEPASAEEGLSGTEPITMENAWSSLRQGAASSWKWTSDASKKGLTTVQTSLGTAPSARSASDQGQSQQKRKAKKPVKPTEVMSYDARARAIIFVAATALGLTDRDGVEAEKALGQTIHLIMNEAREAAKRKGVKDPVVDLAKGPTLKGGEDEAVSESSSDRTGWMNQAGGSAVEQQRKFGWKKWAVAGSGFAIGGALIGVTGGLAVPFVVPALAGLTGVTFLATSGGVVMLATLFGLAGGGLAGYRVHRRLRGLSAFEFVELDTPARQAGLSIPSLHATICVSGLLLKEEQQIDPWQDAWGSSPALRDVYAVQSEAKLMAEAGNNLRGYLLDQLKARVGQKAATEVIKRTALAGFTALTLPMTVAGALGSTLDSLFVRAKSKAYKAGLVLAETLKAEVQGHRPVILIGTSLGSITILTALNELAKDPEETSHLVDSVYLVSTPATPSLATLKRARSIVSRRFVNAYSTSDMVCSVAAWLGMELSPSEIQSGNLPRVLGSGPVWGVPGLENIDVTDVVPGHFDLVKEDRLKAICERMGCFET